MQHNPSSPLRVSRLVAVVVSVVAVVVFIFALSVPIIQRQSSQPDTVGPKSITITKVERGGYDYKLLWELVDLDNIQERNSLPPIRSEEAVDNYIRKKGEARGYQSQPRIQNPLTRQFNGLYMQDAAYGGWQQMSQAAQTDGVPLRLTSAYRSVEDQTRIFEQFLQNNFGTVVSNQDILSGRADAALEQALNRAAPPGYSKHHSGYTIDMCDATTNACLWAFYDSPAERWLRAENFTNARSFGFIPSYPTDVTNQGPSPEPWEYVWVGEVAKDDAAYLRLIEEIRR